MPQQGYESLNDPKKAATDLSKILTGIPFDDSIKVNSDEPAGNNLAPVSLHSHLRNLDEKLINGMITADDYFKDPAIQLAINIIKPQNSYYVLAMLELFYKQSFSYSTYEKIFKFMSQVMLFVGAVLLYENYVLYFDARPKLERTGNGIKDYCNGLAPVISDVCNSLENGMQAAFNMNKGKSGEPFYVGDSNTTLQGPIEKIPSLFYPFQWLNWLSCNISDDGFSFEITGNTFSGSPKEVAHYAENGIFPVAQSTGILLPALTNATIPLAVSLFLINFCVAIEKGGYSSILNPATGAHYGHTNGFELPGKDFGIYARIFGALYGFFVGVAGFTMLVLQARKAVEKYQGASQMWRACDIYKKNNSENASPRSQL